MSAGQSILMLVSACGNVRTTRGELWRSLTVGCQGNQAHLGLRGALAPLSAMKNRAIRIGTSTYDLMPCIGLIGVLGVVSMSAKTVETTEPSVD